MSVSPDFLAYVLEQLVPFAKVVSRRMFGGIGLYADGLFFGLIDDDVVYFKVADENRDDYTSRGSAPFRPFKDEPETYSMSYYEVPGDVLEDPEQLAVWAKKAVMVAATAAAAKRPRRKTAKKASKKAKKKSPRRPK